MTLAAAARMWILVLGIGLGIIMLIGFLIRLENSDEQQLEEDIASCQARGGEAHLMRQGSNHYFMRECWIK